MSGPIRCFMIEWDRTLSVEEAVIVARVLGQVAGVAHVTPLPGDLSLAGLVASWQAQGRAAEPRPGSGDHGPGDEGWMG
jgi:1,4-dihydroxy-2-naphthoyl-CoA synthase